MKRKPHDLNHDLTFSAHTINCQCLEYLGYITLNTYWNDMNFLWFDLSCSFVPNAGTLNCMLKKTTEMLEFTPEIILISEV